MAKNIPDIHDYFRIGTVHWMSYPPERCDQLISVKEFCDEEFFDSIELPHIEDPVIREKSAAVCKKAFMKVGYGCHPVILGQKLNPNAIDEAERVKAEKYLMESVDEALEIGADSMTFLAGHWEEESKEQAYKQLLKTTCNVCEYAKTKGISVEIEVFDYDMDKCALIGPAPYAAQFAKDVRSKWDNFGLLADLSHFPTTYETSHDVIPVLAPYLTHLHIGNAVVKEGCEAYGDKHPRFGFPNSVNDLPEVIDFLKELRANGLMTPGQKLVLSFEVKPQPYEDIYEVLEQSVEVLKKAWESIWA